jgi:glucose-1-phosphate thymidylyltransferase
MQTKGIILAGGTGSRLFPATSGLSKQLLHVYDKPMIYYPLATLMSSGIQSFCIIVNRHEVEMFQKLLNDGSQWGIRIEFLIQDSPEGIPQAFTIAEGFLDGSDAALILGDNLFIGHGLGRSLAEVASPKGAHIFLYEVENPENYGIPIFGEEKRITKLVEKPQIPEHNLAIPGLYFFDSSVVERAKTLKKSKRGEYEIVDLLQTYADEGRLTYTELTRGTAWLDTGTPEDLFNAGEFVRVIQHRQGSYIACLEEIAFRNGWIPVEILESQQKKMEKSPYGTYLLRLLSRNIL